MADFIDISGQRFGDLTALHTVPRPTGSSNVRAWWKCRCVCGKEVLRTGSALRSTYGAHTCHRSHDLTGLVSGYITVLARAPTPKDEKNSFWHCVCKCGKFKTFRATTIKRGKAKSCGCHTQEMLDEWNKGKRKPWSRRSRYYDPSVAAP